MKTFEECHHPEKIESFNLDDICQFQKEIKEKLDKNYDSENISFEEKEKKNQELIKNFIKKLIEKKDKFHYVFKTEKGSIYFVLESGQSWRFQKKINKYEVQPILNKIFFINREIAKEFENAEDNYSDGLQEFILNRKISTINPRIGAVPFEFWITGLTEIIFKQEKNYIQIIGTKYREDNNGEDDKVLPHFASGCHMGHSITEIIK